MPDSAMKTRNQTRRKLLFFASATLAVLALSFCGWIYKAKTQRDLNRQLLGAVRKGNAEEARQLLKRGADPNIRDLPEEQLSLWQQIRHAFHKDSQPTDDQNSALLEMAMTNNNKNDTNIINVALVKTLLEAGARPDDICLMEATERDALQTVQMLLDHGANPLVKDHFGRLPINCFYSDDPVEAKIAELLVNRGEDVNAPDVTGGTPLSQSCSCGNIDLLRFLITHGGKVDVVDEYGDTPLINCFQRVLVSEHTDIVKLLIAHGADVNKPNKQGDTPLSLAKALKYKQSIRLLEAAGAKH